MANPPTPDEIRELFAVHHGAEATAERERRAAAFDDTRTWVDPNGYRLSDRLWKQRTWVRSQIDEVLRQAIRTGEDALLTARKLEQFLDPAFAPVRTERGRLVRKQNRAIVTTAPGRGGSGSFPARRLARTEITRAHGQATVWTADRTPFAKGVKWNLSGRHPRADRCDQNASHDSGLGRGVYTTNAVPQYPNHPQDLCHLAVVTEEDVDAIVKSLREQYGLDQSPLTEPITEQPAPTPRRMNLADVDDEFSKFEFEDLARKAQQDWLKTATQDEIHALQAYKQSQFGRINNYLRFDKNSGPVYLGDTYTPHDMSDVVAFIDSGLSKSTLPADARVMRGLRFYDEPPPEWTNLKPGSLLTDKGYVSTTIGNDRVAQGFSGNVEGSYRLTIYAPKGSKGLYLDGITGGTELTENEILLPRNTTFLVHEVRPYVDPVFGPTEGVIEVILEVIA